MENWRSQNWEKETAIAISTSPLCNLNFWKIVACSMLYKGCTLHSRSCPTHQISMQLIWCNDMILALVECFFKQKWYFVEEYPQLHVLVLSVKIGLSFTGWLFQLLLVFPPKYLPLSNRTSMMLHYSTWEAGFTKFLILILNGA